MIYLAEMWRTFIVDDEEEFRAWISSLLKEDEDFKVVGEADTGKKAIQSIGQITPDVIIADVYMPDLDGFELARWVQQKRPEIKVILVSAYVERVYQRLATEEGAVTFIPKASLSMDAIRGAIEEIS